MIINLDPMRSVWGQSYIPHMGLSVFIGITTHLREIIDMLALIRDDFRIPVILWLEN